MFEKVAGKIRWHYSCYIEVSTNLLEQALGAGLEAEAMFQNASISVNPRFSGLIRDTIQKTQLVNMYNSKTIIHKRAENGWRTPWYVGNTPRLGIHKYHDEYTQQSKQCL